MGVVYLSGFTLFGLFNLVSLGLIWVGAICLGGVVDLL